MPGKESQAWKKWKLDLRSFTDQWQRPAKQVRRVPEPKSTVLLSVSNRVSLCWDLTSLRIPRPQFFSLTPFISPFPHSWAASIAPWNSHPCPKLIVFCKPTTASYSAELRPAKGYHACRILCPWPMKAGYSLQIGISQVRKFLFPCNPSCVARWDRSRLSEPCPVTPLRCLPTKGEKEQQDTHHDNYSEQLPSTRRVSALIKAT